VLVSLCLLLPLVLAPALLLFEIFLIKSIPFVRSWAADRSLFPQQYAMEAVGSTLKLQLLDLSAAGKTPWPISVFFFVKSRGLAGVKNSNYQRSCVVYVTSYSESVESSSESL
jgi:hypothetical protein